MLSRFSGWLQAFKLNTHSRLGKGFAFLALLLTAITVVTAALVVQQLNERDLKRLKQVGQLQVNTSVGQLELLSLRFHGLLKAYAQDERFAADTQDPDALGTVLARMFRINPIINHVLWVSPQGQVLQNLWRADGKPSPQSSSTELVLPEQLLEALNIKPHELWFSDLVAIKNEEAKSTKPLIYGAIAVPDAQGAARGHVLIGVDMLRFMRGYANDTGGAELPRMSLVNASGQSQGDNSAAISDLRVVQKEHPELWANMQTQVFGEGDHGLVWRRMVWADPKEQAMVRSPKFTMVSWVSPVELKKVLQSNAQLVSGIWGSGLVLLLTAVGLLYRRSLAIETFRQREASIRRIAGLGYWRFNPSTKHLELSGVFHKTLSIKGNPQQLWQAWLACFDTDADRQAFQVAIQNTLLTGQGFELELLMHNRDNGAQGWGLVNGTLSQEPASRGWIEGSVQNITKRKEAELAAESLRHAVKNIVDWSKLGVWEFDIPSDERRINRYLHDMLGLTMAPGQEFMAHDWTAKVHPQDLPAMRQARADYLAGKSAVFKSQCRIQHTDGHWVFLVIEGQFMAFDDTGKPTVMRGTAIDATELHQARIDAEEANQAKTRFLSRMSHELRTPLNAIMGYTQLLRLSPHLEAQEQDHVNAVLAGSRHLLNLINDLLQITRDDPQAVPLKPQAVNMSELCLRCINLMQPLMTEKQLVLRNRISAEHWVMADTLRAQQCVINILANAIKYTEAHTTISLEVSLPSPQVLRLSVRDQGPGIAADVGQQVFEPFYRSQDAQQTTEGTGIGLTVSLRLAQQMGGNISFDSVLGIGTVFHLDLPLATPDSAGADSPQGDNEMRSEVRPLVTDASSPKTSRVGVNQDSESTV